MVFKGHKTVAGIEKIFGEKQLAQLRKDDVSIVPVENLKEGDKNHIGVQAGKPKIILCSVDLMQILLNLWQSDSAFRYFILPWEEHGMAMAKKEIVGLTGHLSVADHIALSVSRMEDGNEYRNYMGKRFCRLYRPVDEENIYDIETMPGYIHVFMDKMENVVGFSYGKSVIWGTREGFPIMSIKSYRLLANLFFLDYRVDGKNWMNREFMMGADIETIVVDSDNVVHEATEFIQDNKNTVIGTDGFVKTMEFRPDPAPNHAELLSNIEEIFSVMKCLPTGYDMASGGGEEFGHSISIHIHFSGLPCDFDGQIAPADLVDILDAMIYMPIKARCSGWRRANEKYGKFGDWRSKSKTGPDGEFPHVGFEYRGLPNICITRELTESVLAISEGIAKTWMAGRDIEFAYDEENLKIEHFKSLINFRDIQDQLAYFVRFVNNGNTISGKILKSWFKRIGDKEEGQEIRVYHNLVTRDDTPLIMFHDKMIAEKCFVHTCDGSRFLIAHNKLEASELKRLSNRLSKFMFADLGRSLKVIDWSEKMIVEILGEAKGAVGNMMFLGIPREVVKTLPENHGSRNFRKMFIQSLIRNI